MEAVMDFISEYGMWILVVLVILLITVIGFLVDSKRKKKMREKALNTESSDFTSNGVTMDFNSPNMNNNTSFQMPNGFNPNPNFDNNMNNNFNNPMMNQNMNMGQNINGMNQSSTFDINGTSSDVVNNNLFNPGINNLNNMNSNLSQGTVNNTSNFNNESYSSNNNNEFFTPISEQTPKIEPREVVIPKPVNVAPINNNIGVVNQGNGIPTPVVEPSVVPNVPTSGIGNINSPLSGVQPVVNTPNNVSSTISTDVNSVPDVNVMPNINGVSVSNNNQFGLGPNMAPNNINSAALSGSAYTNNNNQINTQPVLNNENTIPNPSSVGVNNSQSNLNSGFVAGGSNFVFGSGNSNVPTNNAIPSENDNWRL